MMPLIVKDFSWHQTPTSIFVVVSIPGATAQKTDVLTANNYIRVHCHPYIFEAFLWGEVDDEKGICTIDYEKGAVRLSLPKVVKEGESRENEVGSTWPHLEEQGLDRMKKKMLRDSAVNISHQRHLTQSETAASRQHEERQMSVLKRIEMNEIGRAKLAEKKRQEAAIALSAVQELGSRGQLLTPMAGHNVCCSTSQTKRDQMIEHDPPTTTKFLKEHYCCMEQPTKGQTSKTSISKSLIWSDEISDKSEERLGHGDSSGGGGVGIRQAQIIKVHFTPREFPTPARESTEQMEEEWLKKQADARHVSGFNEPDLRPEERDPDWLLEKGRSLMKTDAVLGAVSAFSLGIKLAPKIPELYVERSTAHLQLRNFMKAIDDASLAIELLTPKVLANLEERMKAHKARGEAFMAFKMYKEALSDYEEAQRLEPDNELVKMRVSELNIILDNVTGSDEEEG